MSQRKKRSACLDCGKAIYSRVPSMKAVWTGRCRPCSYSHRSPYRGDAKMCARCKKLKPLSSFHATKDRKAKAYCITCDNAWWAEYRAANRSRVRSHQRAWERKFAKQIAKKKAKRYRSEPEYRKRVLARQRVYLAVKSGRIKRGPCSSCGSTDKVHGHHEDHSKPLEVVWLCMGCHLKEHNA